MGKITIDFENRSCSCNWTTILQRGHYYATYNHIKGQGTVPNPPFAQWRVFKTNISKSFF